MSVMRLTLGVSRDSTFWAREGALMNARDIQMRRRREEVESVRIPDDFVLQPPTEFLDFDSGRRDLMPDAPLILIGRYFRRSRAYAGLSQTQLADMAAVSQSMVSRVERARAPAMGLGRFINMSLVLGRLFPLGV